MEPFSFELIGEDYEMFPDDREGYGPVFEDCGPSYEVVDDDGVVLGWYNEDDRVLKVKSINRSFDNGFSASGGSIRVCGSLRNALLGHPECVEIYDQDKVFIRFDDFLRIVEHNKMWGIFVFNDAMIDAQVWTTKYCDEYYKKNW